MRLTRRLKMCRWLPVLFLSLGISAPYPVSLLAQDQAATEPTTHDLAEGDQLYVRSGPYAGYATLLQSSADSLTLLLHRRTEPRGSVLTIALDSVSNVERYERVHWTRRALRGAKWGAFTGAAVGTVGIVMSERGPGDPPKAWWPLVGVAYFTVPAALIFAIVPDHEWETIHLPGNSRLKVDASEKSLSVRLRW